MLLSMCSLSSCLSGSIEGTSSDSVSAEPPTENVTDKSDTTEENTETETEEEIEIVDGQVLIKADFNKITDPPLLKKVAMYNAGCINPLTNYERDFDRIKELNSDALRIDLSIGKQGGTGGRYLVEKEHNVVNYDELTGKYEIDISSLTYDFSQLDGIVKYMAEADVLPYMSWCYIPRPLQEDGQWHNLNTDIRNWQQVWEEIYYQYAKHYVDAGVKIGYHEIYNEPDLEILKCWGVFKESFVGFLNWYDFCGGPAGNPGAGVYPDMYEYGALGILRADPDATIGGPAFALGDVGVQTSSGFLPRVLSKKLPLDFFSFHTYLDGDTWFMSDSQRKSGQKNELEKVVDALAGNSYYLKTAVHINEYSYLNAATGANDGLRSAFNYYGAAADTLDAVMEVVDRTSVQWVYWAQFMESTAGHDPYGMIEHEKGNVKAAFNAIKIYADMPVWRYDSSVSGDENQLKTLVSSTDEKISILIWNTDGSREETAVVALSNPKFASGTRRVYRIDKTHASYFDNAKCAELGASEIESVETSGVVWSGNIPAGGVVYITINKDGKEDFNAYSERTSDFAEEIKTQYYYEDRYRGLEGSREEWSDYDEGIRGSYSHFDRTTWTMYLGMGDCTGSNGRYVGQAHANGAVICEGLPDSFKVELRTEGEFKTINENTTLGFRMDFFDGDTNEYVKSVYFHNGLYNDARNPNAQDSKLSSQPFYPWGTQKKPDVVVECDGNVWDIDPAKYAPESWNGRVQISFDMQNTGAGTRAMFSLHE